MLPKILLSMLALGISFVPQVGGSLLDFIRNNDQHHRSLDAAEDCVTATIGKSKEWMTKMDVDYILISEKWHVGSWRFENCILVIIERDDVSSHVIVSWTIDLTFLFVLVAPIPHGSTTVWFSITPFLHTDMTDLIDPLNNVSGLWFFPNYLALNFRVCNLTTALCDYNNTDYGKQSLSDCDAVGGKIVKKDVRVCLNDVSKVSNAPAFADLDFINVDFCFAQSCDETIPMVQIHRALYFKAEREKAPGTENIYANVSASSQGLCLDPETTAPVPTAAPEEDTSGGVPLAIGGKLSWIGIMSALLWTSFIMG